MADYLVTGKKGNGKSLIVVSRIRDAILKGKKIATNLDLHLVPMLGPFLRHAQVIRLPDRPSIDDLECIGRGRADGPYNEDANGLLVLDELATWMNSRTFADKGRAAVLDWLAHSRKLGWDTYLLTQHPNQIDKQVREALCEYLVVCRRMDKMKVAGFKLPKLHVAFVRYGMERDSLVAERWMYRGTDLYSSYDTDQVFRAVSDHGPYCLLPPYHQAGWKYEKPGLAWKLFGKLPPLKRRHQVKPKLPHVRDAMKLRPDARTAFVQSFG